MKVVERFLALAFPTLLLEPTPWLKDWEAKERSENVAIWRVALPLIAAIYIGHLIFFDKPMQLRPPDLWELFRLSVAAVTCAAFLFYCAPTLYSTKLYKLPILAVCWLLCFTQAQTAVWYDSSQYLYAFVFIVASTMLIRDGLAGSVAFSALAIVAQWDALNRTGVTSPVLVSAIVATLTIVVVTRSRYLDEIRYFLATQANVESQKRNIELTIEFTERIRGFLPLEISRRLTRLLETSRVGVLEAIDSVLRPEERIVSCLFSDIRGFTKQSNLSLAFLYDGVVPNAKRATAIIEENSGVPRKIGDLIFAYFDDENPYSNLIRSIQSGLSLIDANQRLNELNSPDFAIKRFVLISSGRAVVGNIGGYDSSIEITALGPPVNLLSRLDELTKHPTFQRIATERDLIICARSAELIKRLGIPVEMTELDLHVLDLSIRDFEDMRSVWLLPATYINHSALRKASDHLVANHDARNVSWRN